MLSTIGHYLEQQHTASLADIARHVDADPDAVRGMIDHWVRKGRVCEVSVACGDCTQCDPTSIVIYRWVG